MCLTGLVPVVIHLLFSTIFDGTHGGGVEYTDGVVVDSANFTTTITVAEGAPDLHYYCELHPGMGAFVMTESVDFRRDVDKPLLSNGANGNLVRLRSLRNKFVIDGDYVYFDRGFGSATVLRQMVRLLV